MGDSRSEFHEDFDFDLAEALAEQLLKKFDAMGSAPLTEANLEKVRSSQGIYVLKYKNAVSYIGKADKSVQTRLRKHKNKISGRNNISLSDVTFQCLYLHRNWRPIGSERILIDLFTKKNKAEWNGSSFGSNDPGKERDTTKQPEDQFDKRYPIDLKFEPNIERRLWNMKDLLLKLKQELPYTFRFQTKGAWKQGHPSYNSIAVTPGAKVKTAEEFLLFVGSKIPNARVTLFASHAILYLNDTKDYPNGKQLFPPVKH